MRCVLIPLAVALLFGAGCAESAGPAARSADGPAPASDVAWMKEFCTVVGELQTGMFGGAADPGPGDAATLRDSLGADLSGAADALGVAADRLGSLPNDPPAGGSEAVAELDDQLAGLRDSVVTGQDTLAALPPDASEQDLGAVMADVWPRVAARAGKPLDGVAVTDDMKAAAGSPACRTVPGLR